MPDENENNIPISELDEALDLTDSAQFPYTQNNGGTLTTFKARLTQIAAKIIEGLSFAGINLPTSAGDKTVENSINFLLDSVGGDPNGNISDSYDPTAAYVKGDLCIYENVLYICTAPTTGTFDPSKWTATTIDNVIGSLSALTTTDKSSLVGAVNEVNGKATMSTGTLTGAVSAVTINRGNFWQLDKMIFACGAFTLSGSANAGLSLIKFPTGVSVPSSFDMVCFGADNKTYNCYAYHGNIVANTTMTAQVYTFNFVARTT